MLRYASFPSINAGIIVWFIDKDITLFLDIQWLDYLRQNGYKSFSVLHDMETIPITEISGKKKRVFFDYNLQEFLEAISYG